MVIVGKWSKWLLGVKSGQSGCFLTYWSEKRFLGVNAPLNRRMTTLTTLVKI